MLFPYTYVPHLMDKMQAFINFIFHEVWCKAPVGLEFHPDLFKAEPDLHDVMVAFGFSKHAPERGKVFYKDVKAIYLLFGSLQPQEIEQFKQWYVGNNDLEMVCANDPAAQLARYADVAVNHEELSEWLALFFKDLYSQSLLDLTALRQKIGDIDSHYKAFASTNALDKCPFCGLSDMLGANHTKREAYDHYLPKAIYPFNSINFKNLVPACHHCNSSYKGSQDPSYAPKDPTGGTVRRKVFYPFSTTPHGIELQVTLQHADVEKMTAADISLSFGPASITEQIETWKDVYDIEERYRGKLLSGDCKAWVVAVLDEWRWRDESADADGRTPEAHLRDVARHTDRSPYANANFLKNSYLQACKSVGLFEPIAKGGAAPAGTSPIAQVGKIR